MSDFLCLNLFVKFFFTDKILNVSFLLMHPVYSLNSPPKKQNNSVAEA